MREIWVNYHALKTGQAQVVRFDDPHTSMGVGEAGYAKYVSESSVRELRSQVRALMARVIELEDSASSEIKQAKETVTHLEGWLKRLTAV